ncbi:hypothetical protein HAHE_12980 [Haloferula helveola]|uniref:Protein kinase domain-containing protein n=1 Tax=Haloferula helveola TaxID=490095 RepID=A0ABN6H7G0_9BACT|nr:hypothetical protein HAHE_12980 [Haloferula helveola]
MSDSNDPTCPNCGSAIPEDAPSGLCPACALKGVATVSSTTTASGRSAPPSIGEIAPHFPDLEILELLGAGGMGAVYKARQPQLDRFVALKILSHDLASDPAFVERFNREARVLARLSHPNIVGVHDFGTAGPYCYLTMELVDGVNLRQAMQAGRFTPTEALAMVQHLCSALKFAHEEGILHRDIKPENVLIDSKGRVKIADFGIAKLVGENRQPDVTLTLQGSVLGSPHYMAPEQIESPGDVDQRADIYSLGVVLYELLTGELPIGRFALPSEKAEMDARIDQIVLRTLEKERQARFQTAEEVSTSVTNLSKTPAPVRPAESSATEETGMARFSIASAILTGVSLLATGLFVWLWVMTLTAPPPEPETFSEAEKLAENMSDKLGLATLFVAMAGATGLLGLILGGVALGKIRNSGGSLGGFGLAAFATVTWPLFFASAICDVILAMFPYFGGTELVIVTLISFVTSAFILVRGLQRWAKGVPGPDGTRHHPGVGRSIGVSAAVIVLSPLLVATAVALLNSGDDRDGYDPELARLEEMIDELTDDSSDDSFGDGIPWRIKKPELVLPIIAQPGQRMSLGLKLRDETGRIAWTTDLGSIEAGPDGFPREALLKVGTFLKPDDMNGAIHAVAAVRTGPNGKISRSAADLRDWFFSTELPNELVFDQPIQTTLGIATSVRKGPDGNQGVLSLEIEVTEDGTSEPE